MGDILKKIFIYIIYNNTIYAPIQTLRRRFKDRSMITTASLHGGVDQIDENSFMVRPEMVMSPSLAATRNTYRNILLSNLIPWQW